MKQRSRKFVGIILTLIALVAYAILAAGLYAWLLPGLPVWAQLVYFAVAGICWVFPAIVIIAWMSKPDAS